MSQTAFNIRRRRLYTDRGWEANDGFPLVINLPADFLGGVLRNYTEINSRSIKDFARQKYYSSLKGMEAGSDRHITGCIYMGQLVTERFDRGILGWECGIRHGDKKYFPDIVYSERNASEIIEVQASGGVHKNKRRIIKELTRKVDDLELCLAVPNEGVFIKRLFESTGTRFLEDYVARVYLYPMSLQKLCDSRKASSNVRELSIHRV